jgi:hypothetical protein
LCDPGGGFPQPKNGCPDPDPETGWLRVDRDGNLVLRLFHTYVNDAEGEAYAAAHGLEYPFSNDYYDAATGPRALITVPADAVCTGIIKVGYREPLRDHVVDCAELVEVVDALPYPLHVAIWRDGDLDNGTVIQVSELYRP